MDMDRRRRGADLAGRIESLSQACRPLRAVTQVSDGVTTVGIRGELDLATAEPFSALMNTVLAGAGPRVTLDVSGISFCDMSGLRALRRCGELARVSGTELLLTGVPDRMRRLFAISGLMPVFAPIMSRRGRPPCQGPAPARVPRPRTGSPAPIARRLFCWQSPGLPGDGQRRDRRS
ncbi:STAS domain-containing protein [Nonomuraea sp. NPDC047897]|uniref:STAS domain-containing protein n=1 Tax=Nonomuraea sp. NPDC047897 TaxID=3364346 RepID=UPI003718D3E2